jgi:hypothetical protein
MFIVSNKRFKVRRADGSSYSIPVGYVGDIPDDVAKEWIVQEALKDGSIVTSASHKDADIEKAAEIGKKKVVAKNKKKEEA